MKRQITKFCVLLVGVILGSLHISAQDPIYSQFYSSPLQLNPAFAGNTEYPLFHANFRSQWPSISQAYTTYSASYDQFFARARSGIGFHILSDDAGNGTLKTLSVNGTYSYRVEIKDDYNLKIGLQAGYIQNRLDWSKLIFGDQIDPAFGLITSGGIVIPSTEFTPENLTTGFLDVSTGILLYNPLYYVGISFKHLNNPENRQLDNSQSFIGLPTRISLHGGFQINFDRGNKKDQGTFISPNILLLKQGGFYQMNLGAYGSFKALLVGAWYRTTFNNSDALIFSAGSIIENIKVQYSFDYTVSELGIDTGGAHEISVSIALENLGPKKSKYNDCLSLFR